MIVAVAVTPISIVTGGVGGALMLTPTAPSGLAVAQSDTGPSLTWTDNSSNESGFYVQRSPTGAGTWTTVATKAANATSHIDTTAVSGTAYDYRIQAFITGQGTANSNTVSFTWWAPVQDSFTYTDTDITGATPDVLNNGNTWTSAQLGGGASRLNTNGTVVYNGSTTGSPFAKISVGTPDGKITYTGALRGSAAGSIQHRGYLRYIDDDNLWVVVWSRNDGSGTVRLYEFTTAGGAIDKGSYVAGTAGTAEIIFEATAADAFNVTIGGTLRIGPISDTSNNTGIIAGVGVTDSGSTAGTTNVTSWRWEPV